MSNSKLRAAVEQYYWNRKDVFEHALSEPVNPLRDNSLANAGEDVDDGKKHKL